MGFLRISGYASMFGIKDLACDIIAKGAFENSLLNLSATSIRMLYQHDQNRPIGEWLAVFEDDVGLWAEGIIYDNDENSALAQLMVKTGQMDGLSIGFRTIDYLPTSDGRILKEIDLREISLVAFPMLPRARLKIIQPEFNAAQSAAA